MFCHLLMPLSYYRNEQQSHKYNENYIYNFTNSKLNFRIFLIPKSNLNIFNNIFTIE